MRHDMYVLPQGYKCCLPPKHQFCLPVIINLVVFLMVLIMPVKPLEATLIVTGSTLGTLVLATTQYHRATQRLSDLIDTQTQLLVVRERSRFAVDLHDSVTQLIVATNLLADSIPCDATSPDTSRKLEQLRSMTSITHTSIRHLMLGLHPRDIHKIPLEKLVSELIECKQPITAIPIHLQGNVTTTAATYPVEAHHVLYQIIDLALTNAIYHSCASSISVFLVLTPDQAIVIVEDDGIGFDPVVAKPGHFGLPNMRLHANSIGASLDFDTLPGPQPKRVTCTWRRQPCQPLES